MGLGVMRWPLRPAAVKKLQVSIKLHSLEGLKISGGDGGGVGGVGGGDDVNLAVLVKWRGSRGGLGYRFAMKRSQSRTKLLQSSGVVDWEQSFENICSFALAKDGVYQPWPVSLVVCKPVYGTLRTNPIVLGTVLVDLAELVGNAADEESRSKKLPITCNFAGSEIEALLSVSITFIELRNMFEGFESVQKFMAPAMACMGDTMWDSDDERTQISIRKKRSFYKGRSSSSSSSPKSTTSSGSKKASKASSPSREAVVVVDTLVEDVKLSPSRSEEKSLPSCDESVQSYDNQFDSDSVDDSEVDDYIDEENEDVMYEKSISYGTLAGANLVAEEVIPFHGDDESGVFSVASDTMNVHTRATSALALPKEQPSFTTIDEQQELLLTSGATAAAPSSASTSDVESTSSYPSPLSMKGIISWRKRKLNFRSPRSRGEPLLNKAYGEEGGDEIDWDRRQSDAVTSDDKFLMSYHNEGTLSATSSNANEALDFGDELFTVGRWERKELVSRDGLIKLSANVFFASFDQRSESAAGESACTALVAVIADWLHTHPGLMPSKAEFDMLIRDGSAEWRKLCEVDAYKGRFPDRHFDLETVLEARVRPLAVISDKSFVGFFQPEGVDGLGEAFDFLKHAMTFDSIWDEIEKCGPAVYIVSWNDHFFVLRFEEHCCYIIDTLGERLYEGCNQAYVLHFDDTTTLSNVPKPSKASPSAGGSEGVTPIDKNEKNEKGEKNDKGERTEKNDKGEKSEKNDKVEKSENRERVQKNEKDKPDSRGAENRERVQKNEKDKPDSRGAENRERVQKNEKDNKPDSRPAENRERVQTNEKDKPDSRPAENREKVQKSEKDKPDNSPAEVEGCVASDIEAVPGEVKNGDIPTESTNDWRGTCRQFVKGFLAAIQLREAELEARKIASGKSTQQSIYQKLQIEFHYAKAVETFPTSRSLGLLP